MSETLTHGMNCPALIPLNDDHCMCGLTWRVKLQTEQTMHSAWRKRAEEAEADLAAANARAEGAEGWNHRVSVCRDHVGDIVDGDCLICRHEAEADAMREAVAKLEYELGRAKEDLRLKNLLPREQQIRNEGFDEAWDICHEASECGHARANRKDPKYGTPEYKGEEKCEFCEKLAKLDELILAADGVSSLGGARTPNAKLAMGRLSAALRGLGGK